MGSEAVQVILLAPLGNKFKIPPQLIHRNACSNTLYLGLKLSGADFGATVMNLSHAITALKKKFNSPHLITHILSITKKPAVDILSVTKKLNLVWLSTTAC